MKLNKKLVLTLTAGVVATTVAVGGIFAWFTSTAETADATFHTAKVELVYEAGKPVVHSFYPTHTTSRNAVSDLEHAIHKLNAQNRIDYYTSPEGDRVADLLDNLIVADTNFRDWWGNHWAQFQFVSEGFTAPADNNVYFLSSDLTPTKYNTVNNVTPGSFIYSHIDYQNRSTVPVYLRVEQAKAEYTDVGGNPLQRKIVQLMYVSWTNGTQTAMVDGGDGYFYLTEPLLPELDLPRYTIESIQFGAYVPGAANGNAAQLVRVKLPGDTDGAEIIQATNNAVYIADGWADARDVAQNPTDPANAPLIEFIPYVPIV